MHIQGDVIDPRLLALLGTSGVVRRQIERFFVSTAGQKTVNQRHISSVFLPLPPRAEQGRIVTAIDEQFSRLDSGIAALRRARQNLKRMRAAVIFAAVTGRSWPSGGPEPDSIKELPDGWSWHRLEEVIQSLRNGIFVSRPRLEPTGLPILRISAVRPMALNIDDIRYVPAHTKLKNAEDYLVKPGDLLFTRYSGNPEYVGACAMVPTHATPVLHPDKLIRVRVNREIVEPRFLEMAAFTGLTRQDIRSRVKTTAGQTGISGSDLKSVSFPVPPIETQRQIIEHVDRTLDWLKRTEDSVSSAENRSSAFRASILAAAFSGGLVAQDPTDEPASVLLDRISVEGAHSGVHSPARARKPRPPRQKVSV